MSVTVEGYDVLDPVGSGGYSRVYRARQLAFDRIVALKVLDIGFGNDAQRRRFERECRAMGVLGEHPNIVTVFDTAITDDGRGCIVMEYYGGGTLGQKLASSGPIGLFELLPIGVQIAGALETAHRRGVVHRDLKPHNLFVSEYGQPALGDFGISSFADDRTITGGGGGLTVHYAPPEVIEGGAGSAASDVYSLAATLYTLLTGQRPFPRGENQSVADLARRIMFEPAPRLDARFGPPELADLFASGMAKEAADRLHSAEAFGRRLQEIQQIVGSPVTPLPLSSATNGETEVLGPADGTGAILRAVEPGRPAEPVGGGEGGEATATTRPRPSAGGNVSTPVPDEEVEASGHRGRTAAMVSVIGMLTVIAVVAASLLRPSNSPAAAPQPNSTITTIDDFFSTPDRPGGVELAANGAAIEVTWDEVPGATAYQVRRLGLEDAVTEVSEPRARFGLNDVTCVEVVAVGEAGHLSSPSSPVCRTSDNATE